MARAAGASRERGIGSKPAVCWSADLLSAVGDTADTLLVGGSSDATMALLPLPTDQTVLLAVGEASEA